MYVFPLQAKAIYLPPARAARRRTTVMCMCIHAARSFKTSLGKKFVSHFKQILLVHSIVTRFFFIIIFYLSGRSYYPRHPLPIKH